MSNKIINETIAYLKQFKNVPRGTYNNNIPPIDNTPPFYIGLGPYNNLFHIQNNGIVCVGLANLARRYNNLKVPGYGYHFWPGGTEAWFEYLKENNRLEVIDLNKKYEIGTLLIQDYNNDDHGHVAILLESNNTIFNSKIIHSVDDKHFYGTFIHKLKKYDNYKRFTHICSPYDWILKE